MARPRALRFRFRDGDHAGAGWAPAARLARGQGRRARDAGRLRVGRARGAGFVRGERRAALSRRGAKLWRRRRSISSATARGACSSPPATPPMCRARGRAMRRTARRRQASACWRKCLQRLWHLTDDPRLARRRRRARQGVLRPARGSWRLAAASAGGRHGGARRLHRHRRAAWRSKSAGAGARLRCVRPTRRFA